MILGPRRLALALAPLLSFFACADLPDIQRGVCGNGVLDPGEDCDGADARGTCGTAGTAFACRFTCKPLTSPSGCPATFGCGTDETCRRGTGAFTVGEETGLAGADFVGTVDVGGRGAKSVYAQSTDLLGLGSPRLFTFDQRGGITDQATYPAQIGQPVFVDADQDGAEDVVGVGLEGLVFSSGTGATSLNALAFPSFRPPPGSSARIAVVTFGQFNAAGMLIASIPVAPGVVQTFVFAQDSGEAPNPLAILPTVPENLGRHSANVPDARPGATWGLPVVVNIGSREVGVFEAKGVNGKWAQPAADATPLPRTLVTTTHPVVDGAWSFRVDDDDHDDLIVITEGYWEVAFGDGKGGFASRPPDVLGAVPGRTSVVKIEVGSLGDGGDDGEKLDAGAFLRPLDLASASKPYLPLAARANVLTVVGENAVATALLTKASFAGPHPAGVDIELKLLPTYGRQEPWSAARIGDLNGDGFPDVIAGSRQSVDLDFLTGTETILFNASRIETGAPTSVIGLGDFDGDLLLDAAIGEAIGPNRNRLAIAYGAPKSRPETPVVVGDVDAIVQMEVANLQSASLVPTVDLIKDLGVVTTGRDAATGGRQDAIAILRGSGNRLPLSPLTLADVVQEPGQPVPEQLQSFALTITAARRTGGTVSYDVLGLEGDAPYPIRLWSVAGLDPAAISTTKATASRTLVAGAQATVPRASSVAIDTNNDGADESVFLTANAAGALAIVMQNPTGDPRAATVSGPTTIALPGIATPTVPLSVIAGDVDRDGYSDLVITLALAAEGQPGFYDYIQPAGLNVAVVWNRGGTLDFAQPTVLTPDGTATPTAATFVSLGDYRALVLASNLGLHAVSGGNAGPLAYTRVPVSGVGRPGTVRSLASGDVTGDGVDDLVIGVGDGRINVLIGTAR